MLKVTIGIENMANTDDLWHVLFFVSRAAGFRARQLRFQERKRMMQQGRRACDPVC